MNARRIGFTAWVLAAGMAAGAGVAGVAGYCINTTASAPAGVWRIVPLDAQHIERGALVSVCPPMLGIVAAMREGGYLHPGDCPSATTPLLKPVVAVAGDTVTVPLDGGPMTVNGKPIAHSAPMPNIPAWTAGTYTVRPGEVWLLSSYSAGSFDSRYFGPVTVANVRGQALPILIRGDVAAMTGGAQP